mmetsp:Transcript_17201/g.24974  ORF Transcript_17201/g.24974 Transcript_17201/m.24974 type:complete len:91 (-) Transcript_17201:522-794(-)
MLDPMIGAGAGEATGGGVATAGIGTGAGAGAGAGAGVEAGADMFRKSLWCDEEGVEGWVEPVVAFKLSSSGSVDAAGAGLVALKRLSILE